MDIPGLSQTVQTNQSSGTEALTQLGEDYDTFLQLLTAQISNQDPLAPMDSETFVSQLAQLTQVEQTAQTNILLEDMMSGYQTMSLTTASYLVGQDANFASNTVVLQDDKAQGSYTLNTPASAVAIDIFDPSGQLVRTITSLPGTVDEEHNFTWDGRTDIGEPVLDGSYVMSLRAFDEQGNPVDGNLFRTAEIQQAALSGGQVYYLVDGGEYVPIEDVRKVN